MKRAIHLILLLFSINAAAFTPGPEASISILTCSPGKEIYKVYGHSAIRYQDPSNGHDIVYNYGLFDFSAPHFVWRYLRGQNYYLLGREHYKHFIRRYELGGERVTQQTLQLSQEEVETLIQALELNAKPENRTYLYNVLYDNCATRVYDILEQNLDGGIIWTNNCEEKSWRELLHEYNKVMPFSQMGIDMVFSIKADKTTTCKEQMFLPEKLMDQLKDAKKGDETLLIEDSKILIEGRSIYNNKEKVLFHTIFIALLILAGLIRYYNWKALRAYQIIFYTLFGFAGLVVSFIAFFSIHPTVLPNINLLWANPIWLILGIYLCFKKKPSLVIQKILNVWSYLMIGFILIGITDLYNLHIGFVYIIALLVSLTYEKLSETEH